MTLHPTHIHSIARALALFPREVATALAPLPPTATEADVHAALVAAVRKVAWARTRARTLHTAYGRRPAPVTSPIEAALAEAERVRAAMAAGLPTWNELRRG
jgi:hypothetical protein